MASISEVTTRPESGWVHIDALIGDAHPWNYIGRNVLYYSFSITSGVEAYQPDVYAGTRTAFNETQKAQARAILAYVSQITGIQFAETADGNLADVHFANADLVHPYVTGLDVNGYSYQTAGSTATQVTADSWIYLDVHQWGSENLAPLPGTWGYETLLHEVGHMLGLKHPFDGDDALPPLIDNTGYTLMSYTAAGGPRTTYSPYDLAALDWLYGRDGLAGHYGVGGAGRYLTGTGAADALQGAGGNDYIDGMGGSDTVSYGGARARYALAKTGVTVTARDLSGADGTDTLANVERLRFSDMSVNLTVGDLAKSVAPQQLDSLVELYIAYLDRVPDGDGMAYWLGQLRSGQSLAKIGDAFYSSAVHFGDLTGYNAVLSSNQFVSKVYSNVLGRDSVDASGMAYWSNALDSGAQTRASLVASILGSAHTFKGNATWGWVADLLDNKIAIGKAFAIEEGLAYNTAEANIQKGMAMVDAVTPTSIDAAVALIGVNDSLNLLA